MILMEMPPEQYGAMRIANGAHLWLHAKPLDTAIGRVFTPHCPGGCHG